MSMKMHPKHIRITHLPYLTFSVSIIFIHASPTTRPDFAHGANIFSPLTSGKSNMLLIQSRYWATSQTLPLLG
jgi:hypothetical protein